MRTKKGERELSNKEKELQMVLDMVYLSITKKDCLFEPNDNHFDDLEVQQVLKAFQNVFKVFQKELLHYINLYTLEKEKNEGVSDLIRNPMAILRGNLDMLEKICDLKQCEKYVRNMKEALIDLENRLKERKI